MVRLFWKLKNSDRKYSLNDRSSAVNALFNIGKDAYEAIPVLTDALKDPDINIKYAAKDALNEIRKR